MNRQIAIITGSSRGIGKAIALQLARDGFDIVVNYIDDGQNRDEAYQVLGEIRIAGSNGLVIEADVSDPRAVQQMVEKTTQEYGQIDVLVNNAGINKDQLMLRITDDEWANIIKTNLSSAFYCTRAVLRPMMKKRYGRIISISSVVGISGNSGQAHYAASKSGLLGFTFSVAQEYGNRGITANVVAPGFIESRMTGELGPEQRSKIMAGIALGRLGTPEDIAGVVSFLASPQAAYISGQVIRVDGGMSSL